MPNYKPLKLIEYNRDGLVEQEHLGLIVKRGINDEKTVKIGDDNEYPFYLRSCAKPLQASLLMDFEVDKQLKMTSEEIAVCCASHAGEPCHTKTINGLLDKIGLDETFLKCGIHKPLSKTEQERMLLAGEKATTIHNNCSGKHTMMLAVCKKNGWDLNDYYKPEHPLQIAIKKKIYELCEMKNACSATKDGCGVPIYSMPLENMLKGYLNLFFDEKYSKIREAFMQNAYLIGGEDRLDTAIISANNKLVAKVGAGGLCIVVNTETKEAIVVKMMDANMPARAICTIEALKQLGWINEEQLKDKYINEQNKTDILTHHGDKIGQAEFKFNLHKV